MGKRVNPHDYIGSTFGKWRVLDVDINNGANSKVICVCECENCNNIKKSVNLSNLRSGRSKSCGTNQRHCLGRRSGNKYILQEDNAVLIVEGGVEVQIDYEDYSIVQGYTWCLLNKNNKYGNYVMTNYNGGKLFLHNLIMNNINKNFVVDHKDGNPLNNKKSNLRASCQLSNMKNRKIPSNNTSGIKGVHFNKREGKWTAYIGCDNEHIHLGVFFEYDDAVKARRNAELKYFKEYKREEIYE